MASNRGYSYRKGDTSSENDGDHPYLYMQVSQQFHLRTNNFTVESYVESVLSRNTCVKLGLLKRVYKVVNLKASLKNVDCPKCSMYQNVMCQ